MNRIPLSQRDWRWSGLTLGNNPPFSNGTIGNFGCYITSMSVAAGTTPDLMNNVLKAFPGGFAPLDGNLSSVTVWEAATKQANFKHPFRYNHSSGMHWDDAFPDSEYQELIARPPNQTFLLVDNSPAVGLQQHWVLVTEIVDGMPLVCDPWPIQADIVPLCPRFGRTLPIALIKAVYIDYL